jgi:hypothetical protein
VAVATSRATTVEGYLAELPAERRPVVEAVRDLVCRNLPAGYEERMSWGMISYELPLARYPETYNGQPLCYAALAAQKHHYALYLTAVYQDPALAARLADAYAAAGLRPDIGKSCVRFKRLADLPLDAIGAAVASVPPAQFIAQYEAGRRG